MVNASTNWFFFCIERKRKSDEYGDKLTDLCSGFSSYWVPWQARSALPAFIRKRKVVFFPLEGLRSNLKYTNKKYGTVTQFSLDWQKRMSIYKVNNSIMPFLRQKKPHKCTILCKYLKYTLFSTNDYKIDYFFTQDVTKINFALGAVKYRSKVRQEILKRFTLK